MYECIEVCSLHVCDLSSEQSEALGMARNQSCDVILGLQNDNFKRVLGEMGSSVWCLIAIEIEQGE